MKLKKLLGPETMEEKKPSIDYYQQQQQQQYRENEKEKEREKERERLHREREREKAAAQVSSKKKVEQRISTMSEAQIMEKLRSVVSKGDPTECYKKIKKVGQG